MLVNIESITIGVIRLIQIAVGPYKFRHNKVSYTGSC